MEYRVEVVRRWQDGDQDRPPMFIYLQVGEDYELENNEWPLEGVTWCVDRIFETDIKYMLVPAKWADTKEAECLIRHL